MFHLYIVQFFISQESVQKWWKLCKEKQIPVSEQFSLLGTLGDPVTTRTWQIAGLPVDRYTTG
jgi:dynein heavy chain